MHSLFAEPGRGAAVRDSLPVVVGGAALLLIEAAGFMVGGAGLILASGLLIVVAGVLLARLTLATAGLGAAILAAFLLPWNGWLIGGLRPGDVFVFLALPIFFARNIRHELPRLPRATRLVGFVVFLVMAVHAFHPTDPKYLGARVIVDALGRPITEIQTNLGVGFKFLVAVLALPWLFICCVQQNPRAIGWLMTAYAAGTSVSGLVAFSDAHGTSLGQSLTHNPSGGGREGGLSDHPNFLASSCVLAAAMVFWLLIRGDRRSRILGLLLSPGILLGTYASGSRGGAVAIVVVIVGCIVITPKLRPHLIYFGLGFGALIGVTFVVIPSLGSSVLRAVRLTGSTSASGSDYVRALVGAQGGKDFHHNPIFGIGLQVGAEAQNVYLEQLASGGLVLFFGLLLYLLWGIDATRRLVGVTDLAGPLLMSLVGMALLEYVAASLTDRFFWVPAALVATLYSHHRLHPQPTSDSADQPVTNTRAPQAIR